MKETVSTKKLLFQQSKKSSVKLLPIHKSTTEDGKTLNSLNKYLKVTKPPKLKSKFDYLKRDSFMIEKRIP